MVFLAFFQNSHQVIGGADRRSTNQLLAARFKKTQFFLLFVFFAFFYEFEPCDWWSRYSLHQSVGCDSVIKNAVSLAFCFFAFFYELEPGDWWSRYSLHLSVGCDS